ncbi:1-deoxy-D-xylulose-5-phosphate reductoisomerase [Chiayiivirga flava]|uniref:1-deoxy-D-xylulose 5-phosphate reductoisomerase n=1 Tax=Chiayiivirga flava TaxID=659595 RepID=A0A7W8D511_9GAMM|nr:1-deoxy-D-xylulose-5-phosphate reductoisomerase [Chiayiivirga flava]MBB5206925.1 1-deoxy-D-xylulose-5-phosphate reductoisomerase [Chiayiivirga flava]
MRRVAVFGATGSIGASTLDVIARHPDRFRATALTANDKVDELVALCVRHRPDIAVVADASRYAALRDALAGAGLHTEARAGSEALVELAGSDACDTVVAAIVGAAGLPSTLAAARAGKRLLLANKEAIVVAGALLVEAVAANGAELLPIDSEHNAIFQCLPGPAIHGAARPGVRRIVLTASGGPFRGRTRAQLAEVSPDEACAHPKWRMGRKISVDSATLMNKGLEVIEAHWLFGAAADAIDVVVHPQSIVHSLVEYADGSMLAQLGNPDMRTALAYGLAWPDRIDAGVAPLDLAALARLDFEAPDRAAFPCLDLAYRALREGGGAATVLNAANEVAVSAFLQGRLGFLGIATVLAAALDALHGARADSLDALLALDAEARRVATTLLRSP